MFFAVVGIGFPAPPPTMSASIDNTEIRKTMREDGELAIVAVLADVAMGDVGPIYWQQESMVFLYDSFPSSNYSKTRG